MACGQVASMLHFCSPEEDQLRTPNHFGRGFAAASTWHGDWPTRLITANLPPIPRHLALDDERNHRGSIRLWVATRLTLAAGRKHRRHINALCCASTRASGEMRDRAAKLMNSACLGDGRLGTNN